MHIFFWTWHRAALSTTNARAIDGLAKKTFQEEKLKQVSTNIILRLSTTNPEVHIFFWSWHKAALNARDIDRAAMNAKAIERLMRKRAEQDKLKQLSVNMILKLRPADPDMHTIFWFWQRVAMN